jgi:hypothetical protein
MYYFHVFFLCILDNPGVTLPPQSELEKEQEMKKDSDFFGAMLGNFSGDLEGE